MKLKALQNKKINPLREICTKIAMSSPCHDPACDLNITHAKLNYKIKILPFMPSEYSNVASTLFLSQIFLLKFDP